MKIEINNDRKIFAIQEEFNNVFPGLELAFHERPSKPGGTPSEKLVKSASKTLSECRAVHNAGTISILPGMTVGEVKQNFSDVFGLAVEVFPKAKGVDHRSPVAEMTIL